MMSDNPIHKSQGIIYTDIELHFASITYTILSVLLVSFFFENGKYKVKTSTYKWEYKKYGKSKVKIASVMFSILLLVLTQSPKTNS
jgi:hypothetical protein